MNILINSRFNFDPKFGQNLAETLGVYVFRITCSRKQVRDIDIPLFQNLLFEGLVTLAGFQFSVIKFGQNSNRLWYNIFGSSTDLNGLRIASTANPDPIQVKKRLREVVTSL